MFKSGEYIVVLKERGGAYIKTNHIYRQDYKDSVLYTNRCSKNETTSCHTIKHSNVDNSWRYATPREISEYIKLGKPYDVTTIKNNRILNYFLW